MQVFIERSGTFESLYTDFPGSSPKLAFARKVLIKTARAFRAVFATRKERAASREPSDKRASAKSIDEL